MTTALEKVKAAIKQYHEAGEPFENYFHIIYNKRTKVVAVSFRKGIPKNSILSMGLCKRTRQIFNGREGAIESIMDEYYLEHTIKV